MERARYPSTRAKISALSIFHLRIHDNILEFRDDQYFQNEKCHYRLQLYGMDVIIGCGTTSGLIQVWRYIGEI